MSSKWENTSMYEYVYMYLVEKISFRHWKNYNARGGFEGFRFSGSLWP